MKQRAIIDVICKAGVENLATEIGELLGRELSCNDIKLHLISKETIFRDLNRVSSVLTRMTIGGEKEGDCYLITQLDSAIILGGTLIMLPDDVIEEQVRNGKLDGELNDAFSEVANIIAGVFTQSFVDKYSKTIHFIKKSVEELPPPTKIDMASDAPCPPGNYYVASCQISDGENSLGLLEFVVPASAFDLEAETPKAAASEPATLEPLAAPVAPVSTQPEPTTGQPANKPTTAATAEPAFETTATVAPVPGPSAGASPASQAAVEFAATTQPAAPLAATGTPLVLVISENAAAAQMYAEILSSAQYDCKVLSFKEDIKSYFQQNQIIGAILIMSQVNEKGFAAAIKLQSSGQVLPPLIFAGPEWTRTSVLKAIKYGARDILITPASGDEIEEKISQHFRKAS